MTFIYYSIYFLLLKGQQKLSLCMIQQNNMYSSLPPYCSYQFVNEISIGIFIFTDHKISNFTVGTSVRRRCVNTEYKFEIEAKNKLTNNLTKALTYKGVFCILIKSNGPLHRLQQRTVYYLIENILTSA